MRWRSSATETSETGEGGAPKRHEASAFTNSAPGRHGRSGDTGSTSRLSSSRCSAGLLGRLSRISVSVSRHSGKRRRAGGTRSCSCWVEPRERSNPPSHRAAAAADERSPPRGRRRCRAFKTDREAAPVDSQRVVADDLDGTAADMCCSGYHHPAKYRVGCDLPPSQLSDDRAAVPFLQSARSSGRSLLQKVQKNSLPASRAVGVQLGCPWSRDSRLTAANAVRGAERAR